MLVLATSLAWGGPLLAITAAQADATGGVALARDHAADGSSTTGRRFEFHAVQPAASGLVFRHRSGAAGTEKRFMIECVGAGLGLVDVDDDGDLDLYLVQGGDVSSRGEVRVGAASGDVLFLNAGDGRFVDAGTAAGELSQGFGFGVAAGDVDDDGDEDLLVTNLGSNDLLLNCGDLLLNGGDAAANTSAGRFRRAPGAQGLAGAADDWSMGAAFGDIDRDGDLDVYVANYLAHDLSHPLLGGAPCRWLGCEVPCGPLGLEPQSDRLYLNDGSGRFIDVTAATAVGSAAPAYGFQPVLTDVDDDGDLDIFVSNDSVPNGFFLNRGVSEQGLPDLVEQGMRSGLALSAHGKDQAGMGLAVGDVNGDMAPDLVMTNFSREPNALFLNASTAEHGALFFDEAGRFGLGRPSFFQLGWGACLVDADCDGDLDLFVANGHVYPQVDACGISQVRFAQGDQLFANDRERFREVTEEAGPAFAGLAASRGAAAGDLDGDGDVDLVVTTLDGEPTLLRNDSAREGRWILLDLRPLAASVGARVWLEAGEHRALGEVRRGSSFLSTEDRRLHFGLPGGLPGDGGSVTCRVRWPDGTEERFADLVPERVNVLRHGAGHGAGHGARHGAGR